jgi:hypothetical protein
MTEIDLISGVLSPVIIPFNGSQSLELINLLEAIGFTRDGLERPHE